MPLLISFIEKMGIEEELEDVFDHEGYISIQPLISSYQP